MRFSSSLPLVLSLALSAPAALVAQASRHDAKPAAVCRDGSRSVVSGRGACAGHGGVAPAHRTKRVEKHTKAKAASAEVQQQGRARVKPASRPATRGTKAHAKRAKVESKNAQKPRAQKKARTERKPKPDKKPRAEKKRSTEKHTGAEKTRGTERRTGAEKKPGLQAKASPAPRAKSLARQDRPAKKVDHPMHARRTAKSEIRIATMATHFRCKDGTVSDGATRDAACAGHGGAER